MLRGILTSSKVHAQFLRYFFVAWIGLVVDFGLVIFCKEVLDLYYLIAVIIGFMVGLIVTYFMSNWFVFGNPKGNKLKAFLLFGIIGLVGLGILTFLMWTLTGLIGINYIIAKIIATAFVFCWNFMARRTLYDPQEINLPYEI